MNRTWILVVVLTCSALVYGQAERIPVFVSGTEGHKSYRIPAIIALPNGDLLAFAEGRVHGAGDFGDINIVMKRSRDKGETWSALQYVAEYDTLQCGNPAPVLDITDPRFPKGRIFLFYNTGNNHENEVRKGKGYKQVWYKTSADGGKTWSSPVDITLQVHRPLKPEINSAYRFPEDWRTYANTPGHALQLLQGPKKGRIFVAANHSAGDPKTEAMDYDAHGFYTDDHGESFHLGSSLNFPGSNESMAAEISGGGIMMNSRNQRGNIRARIVSISSDGGQRWDTSYFDRSLPDPVCQGSILNLGMKKGKQVLAFCNAADEKRRDSLRLRISEDEGRQWGKSFLVDADATLKDNAAYSDLVVVSGKEVGILYEKNNYAQIVFTVIRWR